MPPSSISRFWHLVTYAIPTTLRYLLNDLLTQASSGYIDLQTALMVAMTRTFTTDPTPVSMEEEQRKSIAFANVDKGIKVEPMTFALSGKNNIAEAVRGAIVGLGGCEGEDVPNAAAVDVRAECLVDTRQSAGHRGEDEAGDGVTYIYLHGGQFYMRNAAAFRGVVSKLIKDTPAKCVSIDYRLAPQDPFPAPLVDTVVTYLSLLYPSPESRLRPVSAASIGICGDSSGGNLAIAFLQLLLHWQRTQQKIEFGGRVVQVPLPGAVAIHSGYMDLARSLPSEEENLAFDVIPSAFQNPFPVEKYIQDTIWPCNPPRHHVYAPTSLIPHPLVSPTAATDWSDCPTKIWISVGQECLADGSVVLAKSMARCGVRVRLEVYRGMPHNFLVRLPDGVQGMTCGENCREFLLRECSLKAHAKSYGSEGEQAVVFEPDSRKRGVPLEELGPQLSARQVREGMEERIRSWGVAASRVSH
ncbi:hypothetical protein M409DRAFT_25973 [Zasmidium cellare ATCC 36951]|uniref:Alpha/beta hydrolase fold-3 domain-containing protein n=1 Tax=Zasmidium cellare ATCC 36951 TaxID=1080233 RepID=A0A6A6CCY8_ZASCE|nr:uncharacterized protein M409DRAFT_25973 [Zasmidium cellare ATCC 36951]KAF2163792.1 hypothetical protein M409DRAFT_25973 [Zasmidium cellare ATCC 36951]